MGPKGPVWFYQGVPVPLSFYISTIRALIDTNCPFQLIATFEWDGKGPQHIKWVPQ